MRVETSTKSESQIELWAFFSGNRGISDSSEKKARLHDVKQIGSCGNYTPQKGTNENPTKKLEFFLCENRYDIFLASSHSS